MPDVAESETPDSGNEFLAVYEQIVRSAPSVAPSYGLEPSMLRVVSAQEIRRAGLRNMLDVLEAVPGMQAALDIESVLGIGYRGTWAYEGKLGLLVDGHSIQDLGYSSIPIGENVPVALIERVEIFRGPPGAALFGDAALLGLINVVMRQPDDWSESEAHFSAGTAGGGLGHARLSGVVGSSTSWGTRPVRYSLAGSVGRGARSTGDYIDVYGGSVRMNGEADVDSRYMTGRFEIGEFNLSAMLNDEFVGNRDGYDAILTRNYPTRFLTASLRTDYHRDFGPLGLVANLGHTRQTPWHNIQDTSADPDNAINFDAVIDRTQAGAALHHRFGQRGLVYAGAEYFRDDAWVGGATAGQTWLAVRGSSHTELQRAALYAQGMATWTHLSLSAGIRAEYDIEYGDTPIALPRAGLATEWGPWYAKLSGASSLRAPGVQNRVLAPDLADERAQSYELESGLELVDGVTLAGTGFFMRIDDAIVYGYDETTGREYYVNQEGNDVVGAEAVLTWEGNRVTARAGWGMYRVIRSNIPAFADPLDDRRTVGLAPQRAHLTTTVNPWRKFYVTASSAVIGPYTRYIAVDAAGNPMAAETDPVATLSTFARWEDAWVQGLALGVGAADLLDNEPDYVQPYDGLHAPQPRRGREIYMQVAYSVR